MGQMASLRAGWRVACVAVFGAAVTACNESSTTDPGAEPPAAVPGAEWDVHVTVARGTVDTRVERSRAAGTEELLS